jgi:hypothetical protein
MRQVGCGAHMEEKRNAYGVLHGKSEERRPLGRPGNRQIILQLLLYLMGRCGLNSSGSGYVIWVGSCEHSNDPICSIKCRQLLH